MKKAFLWGAALCAALIFMGCPTDDDKKEKKKEEPFTLTVTGIPAPPTGSMIGASLMNPSDVYTPIATGMETGGSSGLFSFYHPGADGRMPSSTPFNEPGQYIIQLAEVSLSGGAISVQKVYMYMATEHPTPFSFPTQQSIPWLHFQEVPYTP